jgi:undecaprenyl-diphosphatase
MQYLINLDRNIFYTLNSLVNKSAGVDEIIKILAVYLVYLIPLAMVFFWIKSVIKKDTKDESFLLQLFIFSVISWQVIAAFLGKIINRARPFDYAGVKEVVFHLPSYSFPSDHALFLAFVTTYLFLGKYNKLGYVSLAITITVSLARVIGGLHWPGDVLGGWIIGAMLAYLFYLIRKPAEKYIFLPIINLLRVIHLA